MNTSGDGAPASMENPMNTGLDTSFLSTLVFISSLVLAGCGDTHARQSHAGKHDHEHPAPAATYKAGYGVQLTEAGRRFAGLQTGEVGTLTVGDTEVAAVPTEALLRTVRGDFVYVTNGDWYLRTPVVVGVASGDRMEVKDGLYEGDTIVTKGVRALSLSEIQALNGGVGCADGH